VQSRRCCLLQRRLLLLLLLLRRRGGCCHPDPCCAASNDAAAAAAAAVAALGTSYSHARRLVRSPRPGRGRRHTRCRLPRLHELGGEHRRPWLRTLQAVMTALSLCS
jgi:hypothetical protein